eukprot:CAMPEP_0197053672 /NCGR_PEP_ID=MMETSP1384-20130603/27882_1 /TAXON_ID=29189 /ORGANISM="Ammonia sp." /LENGTH=353 /DNA_ID=CAMNT_0042486607 /DNA_START=91 /DNA_END=1152 /DNA_ORIENTATION=+
MKRNIVKHGCNSRLFLPSLQPAPFASHVQHPRAQRLSFASQAAAHSVLNEQQKEFLTENGYLWLKQFVPNTVARNVKKRVLELLTEFDPQSTKSIFRTHRTEVQHKDLYFLESGDKIRYFWEEHAFDADGNLTRHAHLAINKIGHALHTLDPVIHSYVYGYLPQLTFDIGMKQPIPVQSMYICKQPGIGGEVGVHQDSTFLLTEPVKSVHGLWLCIDDTDTSNGCIWLVPGSHKDAAIGLRNRFRRTQQDYEQTELVPLIEDGALSKEGGIAVEAKCGDLLVLHGELVHWSDANLSDQSRHALMIHCVDGQYSWPKDNWLQYEKGTEAFPRFTLDDVNLQQQTRQKVVQYDTN